MDNIVENNLETFAKGFMQQQQDYSDLLQENARLKERIRTMQGVIDLNEEVVLEALRKRPEGADDGMDYLEKNFVITDEDLYERIESCD